MLNINLSILSVDYANKTLKKTQINLFNLLILIR